MQKSVNKIAKDVNFFLKKYLKTQKKSNLLLPMKYGIFPGGKKIRSKILIDIGKMFKINYDILLRIGAAVECIHAYSLIHDDLPCMDDDIVRRGKPSMHIKYGESTALLAGNSLLTLAFEILSDKQLKLNEKIKIKLIKKLSQCSGHAGVAGGQFLDLDFEKKNISMNKVIDMQLKKTGQLFSFCCLAPLIIAKKNKKLIQKFQSIGSEIGFLFQITDDLIDDRGSLESAGKKTKKDKKKGKATVIRLLGYKNTIKYAEKLKLNIKKKLKNSGYESNNINQTLEYFLKRSK